MSLFNLISEKLPLHIFHLDTFWTSAEELGEGIYRSDFGQWCKVELSEAGEKIGAYLLEKVEDAISDKIEDAVDIAKDKIDEVL